EDGVWVTPVGTRNGRAEILEKSVEEHKRLRERDAAGGRTKHIASNSIIKIDGDTATALSDFVTVEATPTGGIVMRGGKYDDEFKKIDGVWLISRKQNHSGPFHPDRSMPSDNYM